MANTIPAGRSLIAALALVFSAAQGSGDLSPGHGGGRLPTSLPRDIMNEPKRTEIQEQIEASMRALRAQGKLAETRGGPIAFQWPVVASAGLFDPGVHGISNFVDLDPAFPNFLLDYNCGTRTYDLGSGYNHRGIDFFSWPYGWKRMDDDAVEIVAAAAGTIVHKSDGNYDRNCGFAGGNWNAVYVAHADGSIAWYGHMKNGSPTPKLVGETVVAGEYLGIVGSSGNSTGPHLHLEVYDVGSNLIEPYAGVCNNLNATSWWANQRAYYDSAINRLETAGTAPVFPLCPQSEPDNSRRVFASGETIFFVAYFRDQLITQNAANTLLRPDGSIYTSWNQGSNAAHYAASYWYRTYNPAAEPTGTWRWQVSFEGQSLEREFEIVSLADSDGDGVFDHLDNCIDAANGSQLDSNGDGYGNACDPDLNGDGSVNFVDLNALKLAFFSTPASPAWDENADFNGDNSINFADLQVLKDLFFGVPGPSAYVP